MPKVVVTGGAGFIGSHVAEHFSKEHEVVVVDNFSRGAMLNQSRRTDSYNWEYLQSISRSIRLAPVDIRNSLAVLEASKGASIILHTAGQVAVASSIRDPRTDFEVNTVGTMNVLEAARSNDSDLVFCSTNKVYGENVNALLIESRETRYSYHDHRFVNGIPETMSIDHTKHSPYGCSKLAADIYAQDFARTYGLKIGVFRMSCVYGERQFGVEDQGWLAWFVIATLTGKRITIYGDGKQVRDVLHVADLIYAFDRFLASKIQHAVLNIGGGGANTLSLLELIAYLHEMTGKRPELSYTEWRPADQKVYISDIRKAHEMIRWEPRITPRDGIKRLVNWVRENRNLFNSLSENRQS